MLKQSAHSQVLATLSFDFPKLNNLSYIYTEFYYTGFLALSNHLPLIILMAGPVFLPGFEYVNAILYFYLVFN